MPLLVFAFLFSDFERSLKDARGLGAGTEVVNENETPPLRI
jgi:hypothetical protein